MFISSIIVYHLLQLTTMLFRICGLFDFALKLRKRLNERNWAAMSKQISLPSPTEIARSVEIFKAFGDQTRYRILFVLFTNQLSVNEIAQAVGLSQSAVSHQLKILRQARLVCGRRDGQKVLYSLADQHIMRIFEQLKEHINED